MRIIDCFPYFNEKELLELRINLLHDKVDKFIICDANKTHKGTSKPFTCKNTLQELGLLSDKIQVVEVNLPSYGEESDAWVRERAQRNAAAEFIQDGDVCIVSDCDEIINPNYVEYYVNVAQNHPQNILRIPLVFLMGRGDLRTYDESGNPVLWNAPYLCLKSHLEKYTLSDIRESHALSKHHLDYPDIFTYDNGIIEDAGWHFSWMGDVSRIKTKSESFLHWDQISLQENYVPKENSADILGRQNHILKKYPINLLPKKIFELPRVKNYLLRDHKINHIYQNPEFGEDWFSYPNLYSNMVSKFSSGSKFVEVGSWKGKSSAFMAVEIANSQKDIEFICIDTWEGSVEHQDYQELKNLYDIFKSNMKPVEKYYRSIRSKSLEAVNSFPDQSLDFVFIDASHEYEDVKDDIIAWFPKVKVGGILAGHDYYEYDDFAPGVKRAVNEIFTDFEVSENCFIVRKK